MPHNSNVNDSTPTTHGAAYKERLKSWAIVRIHPNKEQTIVDRFRSRSDADGRLQCLRQSLPDVSFLVVFDRQQASE